MSLRDGATDRCLFILAQKLNAMIWGFGNIICYNKINYNNAFYGYTSTCNTFINLNDKISIIIAFQIKSKNVCRVRKNKKSLSNCERPKVIIRASDTYLRFVSILWSSCRVARVWVRSHLSVLQSNLPFYISGLMIVQ